MRYVAAPPPQKACAFRGPQWVRPILLCCHDRVGIGESNPGGHERKAGASVKLRTASGPQATEGGAKEEACQCKNFQHGLLCKIFLRRPINVENKFKTGKRNPAGWDEDLVLKEKRVFFAVSGPFSIQVKKIFSDFHFIYAASGDSWEKNE